MRLMLTDNLEEEDLMTQSNQSAIAQWNEYMSRKVPVVIYQESESASKFIVAPVENPKWWLGEFGSECSAKTFCKNNQLPVKEVSVAIPVAQ